MAVVPLAKHSDPNLSTLASIPKSFSEQQSTMDETKRMLEETGLFLMSVDRHIAYQQIFSNPGLDAKDKFEAVRNELFTDFGGFTFERDMKQTSRDPHHQLTDTVSAIKALDHKLFERLNDETRPIDSREKLKSMLDEFASEYLAEYNDQPVKMAGLK
jgi:anion-transporting  ArsA/GET3 family ATPase